MIGEDEGGDPACWIARVCPECGSFIEGRAPEVCPRCGARVQAG
jgi:rubrerythrin